jgi:hypothetical protein
MRLDLNQSTGSDSVSTSKDGPIHFAEDPGELCCSGGSELRCGCGSLLARVVGAAVELKCRRCKRTWNIPLQRS